MQNFPLMVPAPHPWRRTLAASAFLFFALVAGCSGGAGDRTEYAYVAAPEAQLRDRVTTLYNNTGVVHNGERLKILEHLPNKRFVRVRSPRGEEGWIQERYLADQRTFDEFQRLADRYKDTPVQAAAVTRNSVNMHVMPGRKTGYLTQLPENQKIDLLERKSVDKNAPAPQAKDADEDSPEPEEKSDQPAIMEDWWLARDSQNHVGWVLGRMVFVDVPIDVAQYAEGQRIVAFFKLDDVQDEDKKVPEYLVLLTENKDGLPFDFNQIRVFSWNARKHRYETAYRERDLYGVLPAKLGQQNFDKEGTLRTFMLRLKDDNGVEHEQLYKFNPPIVRKVYAPGEEPPPRTHHRKHG